MSKSLLFSSICLFLFGLAVFRVRPEMEVWRHPLRPHSYNHHHTIISVLDDLHRDPDFLKGDLVVEAIKEYFLPYKHIQFFFVNRLGLDLAVFVNIFTIFAILANFIGIGLLSYILTKKMISILFSFLILVSSNDLTLLKDAPANFPRFLAQGICLVSLAAFFKKKYLWALIICSLGFLFHYGMPFWLSLIYFFYFLCRPWLLSTRQTISYVLIFAALTLFICIELISKIFSSVGGKGFDLELWRNIVYGTGGYLSYTHPKNLYANILFPFLFFCAAVKELDFKKEFAFLFIAYLLTQALHYCVFDIFFIPVLVKPMLFNVRFYMLIFELLIYSAILTKFFYKNDISYFDISAVLFMSMMYLSYIFISSLSLLRTILFILIAYVAVWPLRFVAKVLKVGKREAFILVIILVMCISCFFYTTEVIRDKAQLRRDNSWLDIQLWVKDNTKKSDRLIIPFNDQELLGMRIYGKRSVMSLKPLELHFVAFMNSNLTRDLVKEFASFWDVPKTDGIPLDFSKYDLYDYPQMLGNHINRDGLIRLKAAYKNLAYIVTDYRRINGLNLVYQNKDYKIYEIK